MSAGRGTKDPTANTAIARVMRWAAGGHARGCWVNGGIKRHGRNGYRCERCAADREER